MHSLPTATSGAKDRVAPARQLDWKRAVTNLKAEKLHIVTRSHHSSPAMMKLVGLLMATYADPDGSSVRPGSARLQSHTGCKPEAIRRAIRALEEFGLLVCVSPGRPGWNAVYWLSLPADLSEELFSRWGNLLLERAKDREISNPGRPLPEDGSPLTGGEAPLRGEGSRPPTGVAYTLPQEGPPDQDQINDQTTHHSARKHAGSASRDVAEVASAASCTQAEATGMIDIATADPKTTRSASGRLLSDPAYRALVLREVRDRAGQQAREERGEITRLINALPREVAECPHGQHDGLAPNRNDEPLCPHCRRTPGVEALTLAGAMQLGRGAGAA